jgi:hypothetical protein
VHLDLVEGVVELVEPNFDCILFVHSYFGIDNALLENCLSSIDEFDDCLIDYYYYDIPLFVVGDSVKSIINNNIFNLICYTKI